MTGGGLCGLTLTNLLMLLCTLGLAAALASVRTIRFWFDQTTLKGSLDIETIQQDAQSASATAEALAGFLDLDFNIGR